MSGREGGSGHERGRGKEREREREKEREVRVSGGDREKLRGCREEGVCV